MLSKEEMNEKLNNLTGEGSPMTDLISSGDSAGAANIVAACAGMLNIAASDSATTSAASTAAPYTTYTTYTTGKQRQLHAGALVILTDQQQKTLF